MLLNILFIITTHFSVFLFWQYKKFFNDNKEELEEKDRPRQLLVLSLSTNWQLLHQLAVFWVARNALHSPRRSSITVMIPLSSYFQKLLSKIVDVCWSSYTLRELTGEGVDGVEVLLTNEAICFQHLLCLHYRRFIEGDVFLVNFLDVKSEPECVTRSYV